MISFKDHIISFCLIIIFILYPFYLSANSELNLDSDAFSSGLHSAGDTIIRNSFSIYNNPANLIFIHHNEVTISYMHFVKDIKKGTLTYAWRMRKLPPLCIDLSYLSYGSIQQFFLGDTDYSVVPGEELNLWVLQTGLSSSTRISLLNDYFIIGTRLHMLVNHLDKNYMGAMLDSGIVYYPGYKGWALSCVLKNLGLINSFNDIAPLQIKIGLGYRWKRLLTELNYQIDKQNKIKWGNEIRFLSSVSLLCGIDFNSKESLQNSINLGIKLQLRRVEIAYTIIPKSVLGYYHYISLRREF